MTPVDVHQRHCSSCDKVITDFSKMSDDELMLHFRHSGGNTCGRYSKTQLNRPFLLLPEKSSKARWWKTLVLIPLTFFGKQLKAQYYQFVHSMNSPDTAQVVAEPVLQKDSFVRQADSVSVSGIPATVADTVIHSSVGIYERPIYPYIWSPSVAVTLTSRIYLGEFTAVYGYTGTIIEPVPSMRSRISAESIHQLLLAGKRKFQSLNPWLQLDTTQKREYEKNLEAHNPYRDLSDKQKEEPKPQQPALPSYTEISGIMPIEDRKYKRS